jgi:hypothetical protein
MDLQILRSTARSRQEEVPTFGRRWRIRTRERKQVQLQSNEEERSSSAFVNSVVRSHMGGQGV